MLFDGVVLDIVAEVVFNGYLITYDGDEIE
jgi:hypothetical protein